MTRLKDATATEIAGMLADAAWDDDENEPAPISVATLLLALEKHGMKIMKEEPIG